MNKEDNVRPNYFNQHLAFKQAQTIIPKHSLEKGMIFQNRYKSRDGKTRDYMFVVLNPLYTIDRKIHVLSLNEMTKIEFNNMARRTGVRVIPKYKKKGLILPKLVMNESSKRFYNKRLAPYFDRWYNNSYRTLTLGNVGTTILVDYKFDDDIEDKIA